MAAGSNRTVWNPLSILSACPPLLRCGEDGFGFLVSRFQFLIPGLGYRTTSLGQCPDHVSALLCSSLCTAPRVCSSLRGLRAYARLCAATRVCSSLCAAQGELSSGALGPGCPSGTTRQWAAHVLVRQALSKMNRALLVTPLAGGGLPAAGLNRSCATRTPTMHSYLYGLCVRMFACNCMPLSLSLSLSHLRSLSTSITSIITSLHAPSLVVLFLRCSAGDAILCSAVAVDVLLFAFAQCCV